MTQFLFKFFWGKIKILQQRYPTIDPTTCEDAYYHINFYLTWGLLINVLALLFCKWLLLAEVGLLIQVFYREFITDGHLKRIIDKIETPEQLLDLKADLITRLIAFVVLIPLAGLSI